MSIVNKTSRKKVNKYIRFFASVITVLALTFCTALTAFASSAEETAETLTVGVPTDRCPIFYTDKDTGEIVGIGIDLMRIAAEEAGFKVSFKYITEDSLKDALDSSDYDLIMPFGSAVNSTLGQPSVVSGNLFRTPFTLVTDHNRKLPQLNELRVGMLRSLAAGAETVKSLYPGIVITFYDTMDESVDALRDAKVDALMHNSYVWSYVLQKPAYSDLSVQPTAMFSMDFRAGTLDTPKGRALIERLDRGIAKLSDTRCQAVILDYTGRRLYEYEFSDYLCEYGSIIFAAVLVIILIIIIVVLKFRTLRFTHEEKMRYLSDHDELTGALSLNGFRRKAEEILRAHPDVRFAISYSNIKNFKFINDSLGMKVGDDLLRFWAKKILAALTELDAFARIEADHFAVLRHFSDDSQLEADKKNVFEPVKNYFLKLNKEIRIQICIGVYVLEPTDDHSNINVDQMLDFARVAEKRLRDSHGEGIEFYNYEHWKTGKLIADVISHLPAAIQSGEIMVWYQPQVRYDERKIIGAEALCRWKHAERGWISPGEFIPALEEAGLIYDLDRFVWDKVCRDLKRWNEAGKHRTVSVNLSRTDLAKGPDIPEHFRRLTETYGLSPDQLHIEITETAYVENPELLISTTRKFREYGFQVEMDDFGSGYSSLNMLKEVQVDRIKLDLHFLTETGDPEKGRIIIRHIIQMAHSLGMELIAEGVEKEEQAKFLHEFGCSEMQGFYYYKPMPSEDFECLI